MVGGTSADETLRLVGGGPRLGARPRHPACRETRSPLPGSSRAPACWQRRGLPPLLLHRRRRSARCSRDQSQLSGSPWSQATRMGGRRLQLAGFCDWSSRERSVGSNGLGPGSPDRIQFECTLPTGQSGERRCSRWMCCVAGSSVRRPSIEGRCAIGAGIRASACRRAETRLRVERPGPVRWFGKLRGVHPTIGLVRQRALYCAVAGSVCRERTAGSSSGKQGAQAPGARFSSDRLLRAAVLRSHGPFRSARRLAGGQVNGSGAHDPSQLAGQRSQLRGWTDAGAQVPCPACREGAAVNGSSPSVRRRRNPSPLHELRPGAAHCLVRRATRRSKRLERAPSGDREGRAPNPVSCSQLGWEMEPAAESWFPWMTGSLHTDDERAPPSRIPPLGEGQARWLPRMASSEVPGVGRPDQRIRTSSLAPLAVRYVARRPPRAAVLPGSPGSDGRSFGAAFRSSDRFARVRGGRRGTGSLAPLPTSREMT